MKTNLLRKQKSAVVTTERCRHLAWIAAALNFNVTTGASAAYMGWILKVPNLPTTLTARSSLQF